MLKGNYEACQFEILSLLLFECLQTQLSVSHRIGLVWNKDVMRVAIQASVWLSGVSIVESSQFCFVRRALILQQALQVYITFCCHIYWCTASICCFLHPSHLYFLQQYCSYSAVQEYIVLLKKRIHISRYCITFILINTHPWLFSLKSQTCIY